MGTRRINPNMVKLNRSYEIGELARRTLVHKNTIRNWIKGGLEPIDGRRPVLLAGSAVREFLKLRNAKQQSRCAPGEFYCFGCRAPRKPSAHSLECHSLGPKSGNLRGLCESCGTAMFRRVKLVEAIAVAIQSAAKCAQPQLRLEESNSSPSNCYFERRTAE